MDCRLLTPPCRPLFPGKLIPPSFSCTICSISLVPLAVSNIVFRTLKAPSSDPPSRPSSSPLSSQRRCVSRRCALTCQLTFRQHTDILARLESAAAGQRGKVTFVSMDVTKDDNKVRARHICPCSSMRTLRLQRSPSFTNRFFLYLFAAGSSRLLRSVS
jgi:hypothetical protein